MQMAAGLAEHERMNQEIAAQSSSSASEVRHLQQRCCSLAQELAARESSLQAAQQRAAEQAEVDSRKIVRLQAHVQGLEVCALRLILIHFLSGN